MNGGGAARGIIAAGHICLDIIPDIGGSEVDGGEGIGRFLVPGNLLEVGPSLLSTGGSVPNTGLALHRLGMPVRLMGKIGDDAFGRIIVELLRVHGQALADSMIVEEGNQSSYTIVLNPPGIDRIFLHCPGANHTFRLEDVAETELEQGRLFHFGYPPLMQSMFADEGRELERLLQEVKRRGLSVSLDMAKPDPASPAGKADWRRILQRSLPYVDLFLPSFEELLYMLDPKQYAQLLASCADGNVLNGISGRLLHEMSGELLQMGVAVAGIKLGEHGLYVRTSTDPARIEAAGLDVAEAKAATEAGRSWVGRELLATCYKVQVAGTTGAGDCTIAGFLSGYARGLSLERAMQVAVGAGACNVEQPDALSGIPSWEQLSARIEAGWEQWPAHPALSGWMTCVADGLWERA